LFLTSSWAADRSESVAAVSADTPPVREKEDDLPIPEELSDREYEAFSTFRTEDDEPERLFRLGGAGTAYVCLEDAMVDILRRLECALEEGACLISGWCRGWDRLCMRDLVAMECLVGTGSSCSTTRAGGSTYSLCTR
jgi:hypothetical protein